MESTEQLVEKILNGLQNTNNAQQLVDCLSILEKLVQNIVSNPFQQKFRTIKTTNAAIKTKVLGVQGVTGLIQQLGYRLDGEVYVLPDENLAVLLEGAELIDERKRLIQGKLTSPEAYNKAQEVVRNQKQIRQQRKKELKEKQRLESIAENDKKERKHMKADTSKSNELKFGVNSKTWKDIGVDLCKKGG